MSTYDVMKKYVASSVIDHTLSILAKDPQRNLVTLTRILELFAGGEKEKQQIQMARKAFEDPNHIWTKLAERGFSLISEDFRTRGLVNLFINEAYMGQQERNLRAKELGTNIPSLIVISPTMRCNMDCTGCYAGRYSKEGEIDTATLDRIITEGKELGIYFYVISGGEPFLREDLLEIAEKHSDAVFMVYTNGTLIDEHLARRLAELGNMSPAISIEGMETETDARRGPGTFKAVMAAMDHLREAGAVFGFSATYTRNNVDALIDEAFIDLMIEKGAMYGWFFMFIPVGKDDDMNLMCTPSQRDAMRRHVLNLRKTKPIFVVDFWNDGPMVEGCMAGGRSYLHINAQGDIEPCVFVHFAVDNIKDTTLKEALKSPFFMDIKAKMPLNENHLRPCMIVDNPHILRDIVSRHGARPTHENAEAVITVLSDDLDKYAEDYGKLAEIAWKEEYVT
ncbi:MAG: radical SAM protein [Bacillota bacterium]|nr:radical SAM protein [Bacillota bacterium]MDI9415445.1 radical SAM protein [Bacillota bacterium]NLD13072.1 radical SAM protein [Bacillota bacterium]HAV21836.1 radical SAM protein [Bacillota bacterium]HCD41137.1 radical SAM protein [Bacillota bacterium]